MKKLLLLTVISSLLVGCSTLDSLQDGIAYKRGTNVTPAQISSFTVSKTKKSEVRNILGEPQKEDKNVLEYHYQQINHVSRNIDHAIKFIFNDSNLFVAVKKTNGSQFGTPLTD